MSHIAIAPAAWLRRHLRARAAALAIAAVVVFAAAQVVATWLSLDLYGGMYEANRPAAPARDPGHGR